MGGRGLSERRYCQSCKKETLHDAADDSEFDSTAEKVFFGVFSFGMAPALDAFLKNNFWRCQRCGEETER